jgi:hypothetical protein
VAFTVPATFMLVMLTVLLLLFFKVAALDVALPPGTFRLRSPEHDVQRPERIKPCLFHFFPFKVLSSSALVSRLAACPGGGPFSPSYAERLRRLGTIAPGGRVNVASLPLTSRLISPSLRSISSPVARS